MIYCSNPKANYLKSAMAIDNAIARVLNSGQYILGKEVEAFEQEFADYVGTKFGVGCGNGTDALMLALMALGVGDGDEVLTASHGACATASAISLVGAKPVFVDIDEYYTINVDKIESRITENTKAIIPVHLYGQPCEMQTLLTLAVKHKLFVVEDCAQAHGAMYSSFKCGAMTLVSCFSFYPTKNLGAIGDAGIVLTDYEELATKLKHLREYGWEKRHVSSFQGLNSRLDEMQAGILRAKLPLLDEDNEKRAEIASKYTDGLKDTSYTLPKERPNCKHCWHQYVILSERRDRKSVV